MSGEELTSLESVLQKYVPPGELAEVNRILYGRPAGVLELGDAARAKAAEEDYEIAGWSIEAAPEETRPAREVCKLSCSCLINIKTITTCFLIIQCPCRCTVTVQVCFCSQVKIGLIQNKIVLPTDAPIQDQVRINQPFLSNNFPPRSPVCSGGSVL